MTDYGIRIVEDTGWMPNTEDECEAADASAVFNGKLAPYGLIVIRRCPCCGEWDEAEDSEGAVWGVLIDPSTVPPWEDSCRKRLDLSPAGFTWTRMHSDFLIPAQELLQRVRGAEPAVRWVPVAAGWRGRVAAWIGGNR